MLTVQLPFPVVFLLHTLHQAKFEAYVVGGSVRDLLLGRSAICDWDIATNAQPQQILQIFTDSFYDNAFGTVMVTAKHVLIQANVKEQDAAIAWPNLDVFDITTFRTEQGYADRRHPDQVLWGTTLQEDVKRRDFTINAMALSISAQELQNTIQEPTQFVTLQAQLVDYHHGQQDIGNKLIRAVGDADTRFKEDALRMMRAIRIGAELSFTIEAQTLQAIQTNAVLIQKISGERIRTELMKILASPFPADGVLLLHSSGLLKYIIPELEEGIHIPQGGRHRLDVWNHAIESLRECPSRDPLIRLATLLHDVGKPRTMQKQGPRGVTFYGHEVVGAHMVNQIADRLRLSRKQREKLFLLVRWHMFSYDSHMTDSAIRRFIRRIGIENINDMMMLRIGDRKGGGSKATSWRLRELQQRIGQNLYEPLGLKDIKINGSILMENLGLNPGPMIGKILNTLFEEVMEDTLENEPEALLNRARQLIDE